MKPIPKYPEVPTLTEQQIEEITNIVFITPQESVRCDAVFVFEGTHLGNWSKALEAYNNKLGKIDDHNRWKKFLGNETLYMEQ